MVATVIITRMSTPQPTNTLFTVFKTIILFLSGLTKWRLYFCRLLVLDSKINNNTVFTKKIRIYLLKFTYIDRHMYQIVQFNDRSSLPSLSVRRHSLRFQAMTLCECCLCQHHCCHHAHHCNKKLSFHLSDIYCYG